MKKSLFIVAGATLAAAAYWFWQSKKRGVLSPPQPEKENERHHLTNVFSKAKEAALSN